jgi:hypothetical protein
MRGARYVFPGWPERVEQKKGEQKTVYIDRREEAGRRARDYLAVARTPQELAGRLLAIVWSSVTMPIRWSREFIPGRAQPPGLTSRSDATTLNRQSARPFPRA